MTPRLAVTREQAEAFYVVDRGQASRSWSLRRGPVTLRLPERPTMSCPECGGYATDRWRCDGVEVAVVCNYCNGGGAVPIPEGTRVEVGYPCECSEHRPGMHINTAKCPHNRTGGVIPVAYATLTKVKPVEGYWPDDDYWLVALSDIEPV